MPPLHNLSLGPTASASPPSMSSASASAAPPVPSTPPVNPNVEWFYLDPQGNVQGPFNREDMLEWQKGGYFVPTLMLRRTCDQKFVPLGEMAKLYGRNPFDPPSAHHPQLPPPLLDESAALHQGEL